MGSLCLLDYSWSGFRNLLDCSHHMITVISCQIYNLRSLARSCVPKRISLWHIILLISYIHLFNFSDYCWNKIICIPVNKCHFIFLQLHSVDPSKSPNLETQNSNAADISKKFLFHCQPGCCSFLLRGTEILLKISAFFGPITDISILLDIFPICWIDTFFAKVN